MVVGHKFHDGKNEEVEACIRSRVPSKARIREAKYCSRTAAGGRGYYWLWEGVEAEN